MSTTSHKARSQDLIRLDLLFCAMKLAWCVRCCVFRHIRERRQFDANIFSLDAVYIMCIYIYMYIYIYIYPLRGPGRGSNSNPYIYIYICDRFIFESIRKVRRIRIVQSGLFRANNVEFSVGMGNGSVLSFSM